MGYRVRVLPNRTGTLVDHDGGKVSLCVKATAQLRNGERGEPVANQLCGCAADRSNGRGNCTKLYTLITTPNVNDLSEKRATPDATHVEKIELEK